MRDHISSENTPFEFLHDSSEFLNLVLDNINSCILLLDRKMEIQSFNNALKTIFSNKPDEDLLYKKCGNAIGCAYTVEEEKECGKTSHCKNCEIRKAALTAYSTKTSIYKEHFSREFFTTSSKKELKHLQFSAHHFKFEDGNYIILIVEDITQLVNQQSKINIQKEKLEEYYLRN